MLDTITLPVSDQVFTHVSEATGINTQLAGTSIREHCDRTLAKLFLVALEPHAAKMTVMYRGIELPRLERATRTEHYKPLLYLDMPEGTQLLADGSHTYVARYIKGHRYALAYIVPERIWRDFVVTDFPTFDMTAEELLATTSGLPARKIG